MRVIEGEKTTTVIEDTPYCLTVTMTPHRGCGVWAGAGFLLVFMVIWGWAQFAFIPDFLKQFGDGCGGALWVLKWMLGFETVFWATMTVFCLSIAVQMVVGYERLTLIGGRLRVNVAPIGFPRTYSLAKASNWRVDYTIARHVAEHPDIEGPLPLTPIVFDYGGRQVRIARTLYGPEAEKVLGALLAWLDRRKADGAAGGLS